MRGCCFDQQLLFPTSDLTRPFSMLGLGDIVIPGKKLSSMMFVVYSFIFSCYFRRLVIYFTAHKNRFETSILSSLIIGSG